MHGWTTDRKQAQEFHASPQASYPNRLQPSTIKTTGAQVFPIQQGQTEEGTVMKPRGPTLTAHTGSEYNEHQATTDVCSPSFTNYLPLHVFCTLLIHSVPMSLAMLLLLILQCPCLIPLIQCISFFGFGCPPSCVWSVFRLMYLQITLINPFIFIAPGLTQP